MSAKDGLYWVEVDGVKYVFRNHYLCVEAVYEAVELILNRFGGPVKLTDECPKGITTWVNSQWEDVSSPPLSALTDQRFLPFEWD